MLKSPCCTVDICTELDTDVVRVVGTQNLQRLSIHLVNSMHKKRARGATDSVEAGELKRAVPKPKQTAHYSVNKHLLASLGGGWINMPPFAGDEDRLYRWMAEPALWARVIMGEVEPRAQQRLIGLHAALHDGLDASGFVLWRSLPPLRPSLTITVRSTASTSTPQARMLPRVSFRQSRLIPSERFGSDWEARTHPGAPACALAAPAWLRNAWALIQQATFHFLGQPMPVVDAAWVADRFNRSDAVTHALVACASMGGEVGSHVCDDSNGTEPAVDGERQQRSRSTRDNRNAHQPDRSLSRARQRGDRGGDGDALSQRLQSGGGRGANRYSCGGHAIAAHLDREHAIQIKDNGRINGSGPDCGAAAASPCRGHSSTQVAAAALETPFPAERLLRSLVAAGKDDEVLYIDAIVADRYGAAYRLLCDIVAARRAKHPERRLVVVLMAVVSSDVLGRYRRWGFSYGGIIGQADAEVAPVLVDRIDRLHVELQHFEAAMMRAFAAPSPTSVVGENA